MLQKEKNYCVDWCSYVSFLLRYILVQYVIDVLVLIWTFLVVQKSLSCPDAGNDENLVMVHQGEQPASEGSKIVNILIHYISFLYNSFRVVLYRLMSSVHLMNVELTLKDNQFLDAF